MGCHDISAPGSGSSLNQADDLTGLTTGDAGRPIFGNWTGVSGSDATNGWMAWSGASDTGGTGPSDGNPGNYVVLESSPTSAGGAGVVSVLDSWTNVVNGTSSPVSGTFTTSAGTDRLVVVAVETLISGTESNSVTVTYGGQTLTQINNNTGNPDLSSWLGYLNEAGISAKSGDTINVTVTGANISGIHVHAVSLSGVDQASPVTDSQSLYSVDKNLTLSPAVTIAEGDRVLVSGVKNDNAITSGGTVGYTVSSPVDNVNGFSSLTMFRDTTTAGSDAPQISNSGGAANGLIMAVSINAGVGGDFDAVNGVDVTAGSEQYLESNVLDASTYALSFTFDWNMNVGDNTDASLHLDAWNGTSWDLDITGAAINTGNNGDVWVTEGPIDLSSYVNADFQLRIRYTVGNGTIEENDIAVDNLTIAGVSAGGGSDLKVETHHTPGDLNCTDAGRDAPYTWGPELY
jgi:hypothetical protein